MENYYNDLKKQFPDVAERYQRKLKIINFTDPFTIDSSKFDFGIEAVPPVTSMDIVTYLVLTHSTYNTVQMKAYKSLAAYKYFEAGFVEVGCTQIDNFCVMVGKVKHSQKANEKPVNVWIILQQDGSVCTAHCTCMAGNCEACSHVAAVLFAAEYANKIKEGISCTDMKSSWPVPASTKVPVVPVAEMDWGKRSIKTSSETDCMPLKADDVANLLSKIEEAGCSSALMRITEPFASNMEKDDILLPNIFNIYNVKYENLVYSELLIHCNELKFYLSAADCDMIEEKSREQTSSREWFNQRAGRITASRFKSCCKTNIETPSLSLVKNICYPTKMAFSSAATSWGIKHENVAAETYFKTQITHINFQMKKIGFVINQKYVNFGASPDRMISCDCCGSGILEIKCPYRLKNNVTLEDFAKAKNSCLNLDENQLVLDKNHSYFYQIQLQMFVTETCYCDFVVWSPQQIFVQRINLDEEFLKENTEKAIHFHKNVIMPELVARFFTKKEGTANIGTWCLCQGFEDERPMIQCDNDICDIQWYHMDCIGLEDIPNETWTCNNCKK